MAKQFHCLARWRDESRRIIDGTTLCEAHEIIVAPDKASAVRIMADHVRTAKGFEPLRIEARAA
ncbi:MAG: hypothetical protein JNM03_09580 [Sphingopyxis sp.]|uniref:hypothetical protein n=1 Tax=Sphingopyxis sp. TaxID=1908224 RepID=UPI001A60C021|nr:hypothetical protein [Sphingopyxis sp.]MBL9070228.1 hypothetical protein [Sphingopyxis sp.]